MNFETAALLGRRSLLLTSMLAGLVAFAQPATSISGTVVEKVDAAQYVGRLRAHTFDAASLGWANNDVATDQFQVYHSSQKSGGSNFVSYDSKRADALLEQIRVTFDDAERQALERQLHQVIYEEQPYTFLTNRPQLDAVKNHVRGIRPSLAWYDFRKIWLLPPAAPK